MKTHTFYDPIYRWNHTFLYGTAKEVSEFAKRHEVPGHNISPTCQGRCWVDYNAAESLIWIRHQNDWGALAHECLHAALDIFDQRGATYSAENSESLCYYVQALVDAFIDGKKSQ